MPKHLDQAADNFASVADASAIIAMHRRYEAAGEEQGRIDRARASAREEDKPFHDHGQSASIHERDALRVAILCQVPDTWTEAAVLLFHVENSYDLIADAEGEGWKAHEGEALRVALQNMLDFVVSEKIDQPNEIGGFFAAEARRVSFLRRHRSGSAEG